MRVFILLIVIVCTFMIFHDKVLTCIDTLTMPINDEICKTFPYAIKKRIKTHTENRSFELIENRLKSLNLPLNNGQQIIHHNNPIKLAIVIPYRDRDTNLKLFLEYMHLFLADQNVNYGIYLTQPMDELKFNRALLMNIGFSEAMKEEKWNCIIFHDIDLLPENDKNIYQCDQDYPKQLAISISLYNYIVTGYFKDKYFGGINAFTPNQFTNINGFSNSYFNWGIEDDDMLLRVQGKYSKITRLSPTIGRYFANCHDKQKRNSKRFLLYVNAKSRMDSDGLNSLKYNLVKKEQTYLFTRFFVSYNDNS